MYIFRYYILREYIARNMSKLILKSLRYCFIKNAVYSALFSFMRRK